ncbi:MAG: class I SAM-dependent methyltransferase [Hormoscilla sp. GM7CHS1pb]|nr:class I SAM-dependent methyltransferase [Hormoscilla sp. GM7CHS1pb]
MLLTLKGRADEQYRLVPLFSGPLAVEWSKSLPRDEELEAIYNWDVQNFLAMRAYYHDRVASAHIASHRQPVVVELGAGMSTHFHRIGSKVSRWFDLDLPVVTDLRRQLDSLRQNNIN